MCSVNIRRGSGGVVLQRSRGMVVSMILYEYLHVRAATDHDFGIIRGSASLLLNTRTSNSVILLSQH